MRMYAIAEMSLIDPILSDVGRTLLDDARFSIDGTKVIRCLNHEESRIEAMFMLGTDVDAVLAQCEILTMEQAEQRMTTPEWSSPSDPEATA